MGESRIKNAKRNMVYGVINKLIVLGLPFVIRTILIYKLGVEYLGLSSLFSSILQVLNMAELGFSSAITYNLYKPLAENDVKKICALMALYRRIYKCIGVGILAVGIAIMPALPKLINGDCPQDINIYILYIIYLVNVSISYLFFAYKNVLLTVAQRQDVLSNIDTVLVLIRSVIQILLLCIVPNYYIYIIWNPVITLANNLIVAHITNKKFPDYVCKGKLEKDELKSIVQLVEGSAIGKIGFVARNSFDSIILSAFLGLVEVAIYSNYFYVLNAVGSIVSTAIQAITASVGNSIATETVEKNYGDFKKLNFYYNWICSWCAICMLCLYQPFMKIWVGDNLCAGFLTVILFCVYFYVGQMGQIRAVYATASGIWWEFRYLQIGEMIGNLALNFLFGYLWGMNGVVLATIITVFLFSVVGIGIKTFKYYFNRSSKEYFCLMLMYAILTIIAAVATYLICTLYSGKGVSALLVRFAICCFVPNIFFALFSLIEKKHREYLLQIVTLIKIVK